MSEETLSPRDIYIELSDPAGKKTPVVNQHRVWDARRFIASQRTAYDGPDTQPDERRNVAVVERNDYLKHRSH